MINVKRMSPRWLRKFGKNSDARKILNLFFKPLLEHITVSDADTSRDVLSKKIDILWSASFREIVPYRSISGFTMPGYKLVRPNLPREEIDPKERTVHKDFFFLVRFDDGLDYVDITFYKKRKYKDERNFRLTIPQWESIKPKLQELVRDD